MKVKLIATAHAPAAIGPYSQAVQTETLLFCSGQLPLDPVTLTIQATTIKAQTEQILANLAAVLAAAQVAKTQIVKTTVFLTDMAHFEAMNAVYAAFFADHQPARTTIAVVSLPRQALVEIEAIAVVR